MDWIKVVLFAFKMLVKWGPTLWDIGKKIYEEIEARKASGVSMTSDQKAIAFNKRAEAVIVEAKQFYPKRTTINELREDVWTAKNPDKQPKPLTDARLRILPKPTTKMTQRRDG